MSYTFKPNQGHGHITSYRGERTVYVRRNLLGRWVRADRSDATHVVDPTSRDVLPL